MEKKHDRTEKILFRRVKQREIFPSAGPIGFLKHVKYIFRNSPSKKPVMLLNKSPLIAQSPTRKGRVAC
jgi:hypothetical protein